MHIHLKTIYENTECHSFGMGDTFTPALKQQDLDVQKFIEKNYEKYARKTERFDRLPSGVIDLFKEHIRKDNNSFCDLEWKRIIRELKTKHIYTLYSKKEYSYYNNGLSTKQIHRIDVYYSSKLPKYILKGIEDGKLIFLSDFIDNPPGLKFKGNN